jgi:hypothetical protein
MGYFWSVLYLDTDCGRDNLVIVTVSGQKGISYKMFSGDIYSPGSSLFAKPKNPVKLGKVEDAVFPDCLARIIFAASGSI